MFFDMRYFVITSKVSEREAFTNRLKVPLKYGIYNTVFIRSIQELEHPFLEISFDLCIVHVKASCKFLSQLGSKECLNMLKENNEALTNVINRMHCKGIEIIETMKTELKA